MIWCLRFADLDAYLTSMGFTMMFETDRTIVYGRDASLFTIKNTHGGPLTELLVTEALDAAGLPHPDTGWDLFFGD